MEPSPASVGLSLSGIRSLDVAGRFEDVWGYSVASDGTRIFCARRASEYFIVIGDERLGPYDRIARLTSVHALDPVFCASQNGQIFMICDDGVLGPYDAVDLSSFMTTLDGTAVFCASRNDKYLVVCDGAELGPYDDVYDMHLECGASVMEPARGDIHDMRVKDSTLVCTIGRDERVLTIQRGFL